MFEVFKNRLKITGTLWTVTALRISAGESLRVKGSDLPAIKDIFGRPLIPGSSFKGALRSRLESFLRAIVGDNPKLVGNPAVESEWSLPRKELEEFKKTLENVKPTERANSLNTFILANTDLISRLFGSPWLSSKFQVRDLTILQPEENWLAYQERDGVAIARDTETVAKDKLYNFEVVPAGTPFEFRAVVENAEEWELGLLMLGLHQFETEQIPLGSGRSRGLGVVKLEISPMQWFDTQGKPARLLEYLQKFYEGDVSACEDATPYKDKWVKSFIDHLNAILYSPQTQAGNE